MVFCSPLARERIGTTPSKLDRLRLLSPAARKLVERKAGSYDKALIASYSLPRSGKRKTPQLHSRETTPTVRTKSTPHTPSLTDNLLNIAKK